MLSREGRPEAALDLLQRSAPVMLASDYGTGRVHYFRQTSAAQLSQRDYDDALSNALAAVHETEHALPNLPTSLAREHWMRENLPTYAQLVKVYLGRGGRDHGALDVGEISQHGVRALHGPYCTEPKLEHCSQRPRAGRRSRRRHLHRLARHSTASAGSTRRHARRPLPPSAACHDLLPLVCRPRIQRGPFAGRGRAALSGVVRAAAGARPPKPADSMDRSRSQPRDGAPRRVEYA